MAEKAMFRRLFADHEADMYELHPLELTVLLEILWHRRPRDGKEPGHPRNRSDIPGLIDMTKDYDPKRPDNRDPWHPGHYNEELLDPFLLSRKARDAAGRIRGPHFPWNEFQWDHLMYAYMIESTRIYEIFRRVIQEFATGEKLGSLRVESQKWMRNTEELLYRVTPSFSIAAITSDIRPSLQNVRRNAYQRMFGLDVIPPGEAKTDTRVAIGNDEFVATFEDFLHQVWLAIANRRNTGTQRPDDTQAIRSSLKNLRSMLMARRLKGTLSREEFLAVAVMSWLHLTVESWGRIPNPIVEDLRSEAANEEQRLFKIAEKVGLAAHPLSKNYFEIGDPISTILNEIEKETLEANPEELFRDGGKYEPDMRAIINHWSIIMKRDVRRG